LKRTILNHFNPLGPQFENKEELRALIESDLKKDLHMHTCFSDGDLTPKQLLDWRVSEGYELLAVTDHDGIEGSVLVAPYADLIGVKFLYGIEFDSEDEVGKDIHMLGYGFDPDNPELKKALFDIIMERAKRNDRFMKALNERGYNITLDDIGSVNEGRFVGKPTFAIILVRKGVVSSVQEAFNTIFQEPDIKSIKKTTLSTKKVIDLIHTSGGLAVLAHPIEQRHRGETFEEFRPRMYELIDKMIGYGIDGLECHHPSADPVQQEMLVAYAKEHGLMITRGSDFHSNVNKRDFTRYHMP
jgi:predicted metal-dependent phosphoesterase TrpH